jgi:hypothetical protein
MSLSYTEKVDVFNIGLMLISCVLAFIMPFEMFLLAYAILGPLHYLTEISWLHERNYFTKGKYDSWILIFIGLLVTVYFFNDRYKIGIALPETLNAQLTYIALFSSLIFVLVKGTWARIVGIFLLIITAQLSEHFWLFFVVFLPTLMHVYVFTGLFMLFGAIKNKSKWGFLSVGVLILCPFLLLNVFPNTAFGHVTPYAENAYKSFNLMIVATMHSLMGLPPQKTPNDWFNIIFKTQQGVLAARFIAFAYIYHYLNWFSKTEIIKWHKVPKLRLIAVVVIWAVSIALYANNYVIGLEWLFFLSFLHVLLEFPLNMVSIIGIGKFVKEKMLNPKAA